MRWRFRALSRAERDTVESLVGLGLIVYWGLTGFQPSSVVAGLAGALIFHQQRRRRGGQNHDDGGDPPGPGSGREDVEP